MTAACTCPPTKSPPAPTARCAGTASPSLRGWARWARASRTLYVTDTLRRLLHATIDQVRHDITDLKFNTAIAKLTTLNN
jgi:hypothetical protein